MLMPKTMSTSTLPRDEDNHLYFANHQHVVVAEAHPLLPLEIEAAAPIPLSHPWWDTFIAVITGIGCGFAVAVAYARLLIDHVSWISDGSFLSISVLGGGAIFLGAAGFWTNFRYVYWEETKRSLSYLTEGFSKSWGYKIFYALLLVLTFFAGFAITGLNFDTTGKAIMFVLSKVGVIASPDTAIFDLSETIITFAYPSLMTFGVTVFMGFVGITTFIAVSAMMFNVLYDFANKVDRNFFKKIWDIFFLRPEHISDGEHYLRVTFRFLFFIIGLGFVVMGTMSALGYCFKSLTFILPYLFPFLSEPNSTALSIVVLAGVCRFPLVLQRMFWAFIVLGDFLAKSACKLYRYVTCDHSIYDIHLTDQQHEKPAGMWARLCNVIGNAAIGAKGVSAFIKEASLLGLVLGGLSAGAVSFAFVIFTMIRNTSELYRLCVEKEKNVEQPLAPSVSAFAPVPGRHAPKNEKDLHRSQTTRFLFVEPLQRSARTRSNSNPELMSPLRREMTAKTPRFFDKNRRASLPAILTDSPKEHLNREFVL